MHIQDDFEKVLERYVDYYNNQRPCYAIGFDIPSRYRECYRRGELEHRDTFESMSLTKEPKFVSECRRKFLESALSTFEDDSD